MCIRVKTDKYSDVLGNLGTFLLEKKGKIGIMSLQGVTPSVYAVGQPCNS